MATASFERALSEAKATSSRVAPSELSAALTEVIDEPAVAPSTATETVQESVPLTDTPIITDPTRDQLLEAATGVTEAMLGIASYGSVLLRGTDDIDELAALFPDRHVVLLREGDIVPDMTTAFETVAPILEDDAADVILATGPSATADMGSLVYGVHGPAEVHVLIVEEPKDE